MSVLLTQFKHLEKARKYLEVSNENFFLGGWGRAGVGGGGKCSITMTDLFRPHLDRVKTMCYQFISCWAVSNTHVFVLVQEAESLFEAEDDQSMEQAVVLQNLGTVCNYLNDWKTALPHHIKAATIYQYYASLSPDPKSPIQPRAGNRFHFFFFH